MRSVRNNMVMITAVCLLVLSVPAIGQPERGIEVGQKIEPRQVRTIEREKLTLPAEEGLTVLLFWSTWSPRSSSAIAIWQDYAREYGDKGITVYTVNAENQRMEEADLQKIRDYIAGNEVTLPVIPDTGLELFNEIGVIVLPTTLIFTPDGTLDYKYAGLPTSAALDMKEDLEAKLGIAEEPAAEDAASRGKLAYLPKNNALLFYGMGKRYDEKGYPEKAKARYIEALQKDQDYADPLRALEALFFADGRTPETEERLKSLLNASGLQDVIDKIASEGETPAGGEVPTQEEQKAAAAKTAEGKKLSPMERMKLLMEGK